METNYERYFGTPEKTEETLQLIRDNCNDLYCCGCPIGKAKHCYGNDLVEFLKDEANERSNA